jgi:hypothetical protein
MTPVTLNDDWLIEQARKFLVEQGPPPHPLLRLPTAEEIAAAMRRPLQYGLHHVSHAFAMHRQAVADADERTGEPLTHGFILDPWYTLVEQFQHARTVYCGGGKRASKTECAAWLFVKSCLAYPGGRRWILGETEKSSQNIQQPAVWKYLPRAWRTQLNAKESREFKLKYAEGRGFSDNLLVMPTEPPTVVQFLSFIQDPQHYQGWRLGAENHRATMLEAPDGRQIPLPNIGWWADENMPLLWLETAETRSQDLQSCGLWTFSPLEGITATIKEMLGSPKVEQQRAAELLSPDRIMVPGCRPGHMPVVMECSRPRTRAVFFFRQDNPFGRYEDHATEIRSKPETVIMRDSYGWAVDVRHRAFPKFGAVHLVKPEHLPSHGTNYQYTDPAGARRWATIWVRVDERGHIFIYRDWPDKARYGEWAIASDREEEPDGRPGPAQQSDGMGVTSYKQLFLDAETLTLEISAQGEWVEKDPYRRRLSDLVMSGANRKPVEGRWNPLEVREVRSELADPVREEILSRRVDPRAAGTEHSQEQGVKTVVDLFAERVVSPDGTVTEPMMLESAYSGRQIGTGENAQIGTGLAEVNELLDWDPLDPNGMVVGLNEPRLFVSTQCEQVIWMMQTYTARGGAKGGCKDFADLVRYMALGDLQYVGPEGMLVTGGGTY